MFAKLFLTLTIAATSLFVADEVSARHRGCGLFSNRPVRTFFQNRKPVRRLVRGAIVGPVKLVQRVQPVRRTLRALNHARPVRRIVGAVGRSVHNARYHNESVTLRSNSYPIDAAVPTEFPFQEKAQVSNGCNCKDCQCENCQCNGEVCTSGECGIDS